MPDSNSDKPRPSDHNRPKTEPEAFADEESIDLGGLEPVDEGASALSFTAKSGSRNGGSGSSSGSGIRSWEQLVRESGAEAEAEHVSFDKPAGDDVDPASDKDLLKEVLADEPPPSKINLKGGSKAEIIIPPKPRQPRPASDPESILEDFDVPTAFPASASGRITGSGYPGPKSGPFELPPELAATRPEDSGGIPRALPADSFHKFGDDSSILGHNPPSGVGHSEMTSDVWGSSSGVDLLRPDASVDPSGDSLQSTDEVSNPPVVGRADDDSSDALLGEAFVGDGTSGIDLGEPQVDLPFIADSMVLSSREPRGRRKPPPDSDDSGSVDLLTPSQEFEINLPETNTTPSWAAAREDLPPTVPMMPAKARLTAWVGGGAAGLLAGVGVCALLWMTGVVPNKSEKLPVPAAGASVAELADARARADAAAKEAETAKADRDALANKVDSATADAGKATAELKKVAGELARAKAAADAAKQATDRAAALAMQVKQAEAKQAELADSLRRATTDKATAETKLRDADATVARLREQADKAGTDAKAARDALAKANAAGKQAGTFASEVAQRLRVAPGLAATDLLAALDRALARPTGEAVAAAPSRPAMPAPPTGPVQTPQQVQYAARAGYTAWRTGDAAGAEREFARLAASPEPSAIHFYYLGLAQWRQGRFADAEDSFRRGWSLERESHPSPSEVEATFERLDRTDRDLVNRYRR